MFAGIPLIIFYLEISAINELYKSHQKEFFIA